VLSDRSKCDLVSHPCHQPQGEIGAGPGPADLRAGHR
jgi:hypothetical protein